MEKAAIELQGISKSYYSETAVTQALRKISLSFYKGEFAAITGESGGGKSTLLNMIGGMDTFDEGEMFVDGNPTFQYDEEEWEEYRRSKIGYVFQDYSLIGHYTVLDNVMSALLVLGYSEEEAKENAAIYLEQVGLSGYEMHRASELSSGQKQRLSIARALAKNTDIIVADEPTGNLDSETGEQIVKLLGELSKDRLVIMVTHNYEQAEPYVTRKIRIHEGQVISDVPVNGGRRKSENEPESCAKKAAAGMDSKRQHRLARYFAGRNAKTTVGRTILFTIFLFIISTVSFLFIGELFMNKVDYATKSYSHATFYKEDDTRLVVKRSDGEELTKEDMEKISSVSNVVTVDSCDYANDINYYIEEGTDYKVIYGNEDNTKMTFLNDDHFMMSVDAISEDDLAAGHMPENQNEIILYSEDDSVLDSEKTCYFMAHNIWGSTAYYKKTMKVVGILKEESDQIYFSKQLCQMLSMAIDSGEYRLYYNYDKSYGDYRMKPSYIPVVSEDLTGNTVRLSTSEEDAAVGETDFHWQEYDEEGNAYGNGLSEKVTVLSGKTDGHLSTSEFMEVSQEFFDKYYHHASKQASVYITSYAKTDSVLRKLKRKGYEGISTFRLSATDYEEEKVNERLTIIGISVFGLIALLVAEVLILRSLMKIRMKDYFVLKFIGMKLPIIKKISYYEIGGYTLIAMAVTVCLMWILRMLGVSVIPELMWYYNFLAYAVFVLYNLALTALTVASFNRLLKGRLNA
jgi:ABC-type lipoprotein export system ATPase subunit